VADADDEAARVARRVAEVSGWPEWMQAPALGRDITPVVRRVIEAVDAHRELQAPVASPSYRVVQHPTRSLNDVSAIHDGYIDGETADG